MNARPAKNGHHVHWSDLNGKLNWTLCFAVIVFFFFQINFHIIFLCLLKENVLDDLRRELKSQENKFKSSEKALQDAYLKALNFENKIPTQERVRSKSSFELRTSNKQKPVQQMPKIIDNQTNTFDKSLKKGILNNSNKNRRVSDSLDPIDLLSNLRTHPMSQLVEFSDGTKLEKYEIDGKQYEVYEFNETPRALLGSSLEYSSNHVPQNIRHKFGSKMHISWNF